MIEPTHDLRAAYERGLRAGHGGLNQENPTATSPRYWHDAARCLAEVLGWPTDEVVRKVVDFHRERLDALPDLALYPELRGMREMLLEEERGMRDGGLSGEVIALYRTLDFWRSTRLLQETGRAVFVQPMPEQCRVLYVPRSDRGALHFKNVDDPITYWQPLPPIEPGAAWPWANPLVFDGVGSGLHLDEIPDEIFPADAVKMARERCEALEEAREFLLRYNHFWSGQNLLVHDHEGDSIAFEKTRCRVALRGPNEQGINFITGMGALDPGIAAFQRQQRDKYLEQSGQSCDTPDGRFFELSENTWRNMARYVDELALNPTWDNAKQLMEQRDQSGPMCLTGEKCHPNENEADLGYTLWMDMFEMDSKKLHRRQWRGQVPSYLDTPEIVQFKG